jgi:DNA-binding NarL/FixJ family response regulator
LHQARKTGAKAETGRRSKVQILVADDQAEVRSALRLLLEQEPGIEIAGEAGDSAAMLAFAIAAAPDLLLLDWELPGCSAEHSLSILRSHCPQTTVIALSGRLGAREAAMAAGVDEFISKAEPPERLLRTILRTREGK